MDETENMADVEHGVAFFFGADGVRQNTKSGKHQLSIKYKFIGGKLYAGPS